MRASSVVGHTYQRAVPPYLTKDRLEIGEQYVCQLGMGTFTARWDGSQFTSLTGSTHFHADDGSRYASVWPLEKAQ